MHMCTVAWIAVAVEDSDSDEEEKSLWETFNQIDSGGLEIFGLNFHSDTT